MEAHVGTAVGEVQAVGAAAIPRTGPVEAEAAYAAERTIAVTAVTCTNEL